MTLTIELSDDVAAQVERAAERRQMNVNHFAKAAITKEACHEDGIRHSTLSVDAMEKARQLIAEKPNSGRDAVALAGWWEGPETDAEILAAFAEYNREPEDEGKSEW